MDVMGGGGGPRLRDSRDRRDVHVTKGDGDQGTVTHVTEGIADVTEVDGGPRQRDSRDRGDMDVTEGIAHVTKGVGDQDSVTHT